MIYLIFVQYMKHRMQIMQERPEYDLVTCSVKLVQQMTSAVLEGVFVTSITLKSTLKQVLKTSISGTNTSLQTFVLCTGARSVTVCCSPCYKPVIHCFSSLTSRILFLALLDCFPDFIVIRFRLEPLGSLVS